MSEVDGSDEQIRQLLGSLPDETMPSEVETRLLGFIGSLTEPHQGTANMVPGPTARPRSRWLLPAALGVAAAAAAFAVLPNLVSSEESSVVATSSQAAAPAEAKDSDVLRLTTSGVNYREANLEPRVRSLVEKYPDSSADSRGDLAGCIAELIGDDPADVIAADSGTYNGAPALIIATRLRTETVVVDVWVVGPGCREGRSELITFRRIDITAPSPS